MRLRRLVAAVALILPGIFASIACGLDDTVVDALPNSAVDATAIDGTARLDGAPSDASTSDVASRADSGPDAPTGPTTMLVYANTQTDLYSFDVLSATLTHLATLSGCGNNQNDIAIDASGQLYIFESTDAIYRLASNGTCSGRNVLSSLASDDLQIAGRNAGTPSIIAVDTSHEDYYSIDPASSPQANVVKITNNLFVGDPKFDVACSAGGTCWTLLDHSHCSAGSAGSCLYSFTSDGDAASPTLLGAINVHPSGLAYANGMLYGFDDNGAIASISTGASPVASVFDSTTLTLASGTTLPTSWSGAASSSAYP